MLKHPVSLLSWYQPSSAAVYIQYIQYNYKLVKFIINFTSNTPAVINLLRSTGNLLWDFKVSYNHQYETHFWSMQYQPTYGIEIGQ